MTTFSTSGPLDATVQFGAGHLTVTTADDGHATATVEALDPTDRHAVSLAEGARIDLDGRRLTVEVPGKGWRRSAAAVHVRLTLPALSDLTSQSGELVLTGEGELGDVTIRTGSGEVRLDTARGAVDVKAGDATVDVGAAGSVALTTGRGHLRVGTAGDVTLKAGHGQADLQTTTGRVTVKGGGVALDLREAASGEVRFETGAGSAHVGVVPGTTVQLDLTSGMGEVRCDLPREDAAPLGGAALRLRLRTGSGDVVVSRAPAPVAS